MARRLTTTANKIRHYYPCVNPCCSEELTFTRVYKDVIWANSSVIM